MEAQSSQSVDQSSSRNFWVRGLASFRGFASFLLIIALSIFVAILLLKDNLDVQIRRTVEKKLLELLQHTDVSATLDQAEFKRGRGIRLRGIRLVEDDQSILTIDSLLIRTDAEIWDLVSGKLDLESIEIEGLKAYTRQEAGGKFNFQRLLSKLQLPKQKSRIQPSITLRDSTLSCVMFGESTPIELSIAQGDLNPRPNGTWLAHGKISSDFFKTVSVSGEYSELKKDWRVWGSAHRVQISPELFQHIPRPLQKDALVLKTLQARMDFDFEVAGEPNGASVPRFFVIGKVTDGKVSDRRLPFPISGLAANFAADNTGLKFENVVADSPLGKLHLDFTTEGLSPTDPFELVAKVDPLYLDHRLSRRLPVEAQEFLRKFSPNGNIRLNAKLSFRNGVWVPDIVVDLLDVSFAFHKFPYPLTNSTGRIKLDAEKVTINLQAFASGQRVRIRGEFQEPGPDSYGQLRVDLEGRIPIDANVIGAMEKMPDLAKSTRQFHPRGFLGFQGLFRRIKNASGQIEEKFRHQVLVEDVELKYDLMPIPYTSVFGSVVITEQGTSFQGFRGLNVNSESFAQGSWDPVNGLQLTIDSFGLELNESLKSALPPPAIEFWNQLRPTGTIEAVRTQIKRPPGQPIDYAIDIRHRHGKHQLAATPTWFPYELRNVSASVTFRPNEFEIQSIKGHHRKSTITASGDGKFDARGWECHFRRLIFDRLVADREFTSALPESLGNTIESFQVDGLINIGGTMSFKSIPVPGTENLIQTSWDLTADVDQGSILCGIEIEDIYGAIRLTGYARGETFESFGGIDVDSLVWNDIQFSQVHSPIYMNNNVALLGLWATSKKENAKPEPLTATLFGGRLAGNAQFSLHQNQPFQIQATLNDGDLQEFTFELAPSYEDIVGKGYGGIRITGDNTGTHSLRGEGQIRLVDAKISEIPVMLSMLKLLSVNQVDRTLFNESNIDFTIKGEHVFFDDLEFLGDAISIKGNGEMDFDQNIDLQFYTAVGRDGFKIPLVSPLLGLASQQILVIDVKGKTDEPIVKKNFFKILNGKLKSNLVDLEESGDKLIEAAERPFQSLFRHP